MGCPWLGHLTPARGSSCGSQRVTRGHGRITRRSRTWRHRRRGRFRCVCVCACGGRVHVKSLYASVYCDHWCTLTHTEVTEVTRRVTGTPRAAMRSPLTGAVMAAEAAAAAEWWRKVGGRNRAADVSEGANDGAGFLSVSHARESLFLPPSFSLSLALSCSLVFLFSSPPPPLLRVYGRGGCGL